MIDEERKGERGRERYIGRERERDTTDHKDSLHPEGAERRGVVLLHSQAAVLRRHPAG